MTEQTEVIIIGAGMAGLSAAQALQEDDYDVIVLEGRSRIGGRVWTNYDWPNAPLELGARWIHGIKKNPLTQLADQINAARRKIDYDEGAWLYDTDGRPLDDDAWEYLEELGEGLLHQAIQAWEKSDADDCSIETTLNNFEPYQSLSEKDRRYFHFYVNSYLEHEYSADIAQLSTANMDDSEEFEGDDVIFLKGYDQIIQHLSQELDIRLGHRVQKIDYGEGVSVHTDQGVFTADQAIVTLPLGVLKRGEVEFVPPLPDKKQAAIDKLDVGVLNTTNLRFPHAFWPKEPQILNYIPAQKGRWAEWFNVYHYTNQPVLSGYNAGSYGRDLEAKSDEEIVAEAMAVLRTMYGNDIPDPLAWHITRWASDPFAAGSYSFNAVGASRKTRKRLAKPVQDCLFFAGEATSLDYPATVHGAYLSGQREAARIMDL